MPVLLQTWLQSESTKNPVTKKFDKYIKLISQEAQTTQPIL